MTIKVPDNFRPLDYRVKLSIPKPDIDCKKNEDGSFTLCAGYSCDCVLDFAREAAREMNDKVKAELIDELLKLNGYVPERTCMFSKHESTKDPYPICSACGYETDWHECEWTDSETFIYEKPFCPNCGARVME